MQRAINNGSDFMEYAYPGGLRAGSDPQPVPASCRDPDSHSCPRSAHPSANPNSCSGSPYFYPGYPESRHSRPDFDRRRMDE